MTDYTRLAAAGLIMLAMLIAGCGGDDPISPTAPSATLTAGAAPPGQTAPTVSALGKTIAPRGNSASACKTSSNAPRWTPPRPRGPLPASRTRN